MVSRRLTSSRRRIVPEESVPQRGVQERQRRLRIVMHKITCAALTVKCILGFLSETIEMFTSPLEPGQTVKVIKGPLSGLEGELLEIEGKSKVVVRLDLLGCAGVDMPAGYVEAI